MADFPSRLGSLLEAHASAMPQALRRSLVSALILMRNRNQVTPTALLGLFFTLFRGVWLVFLACFFYLLF
jgi:protein SDA1